MRDVTTILYVGALIGAAVVGGARAPVRLDAASALAAAERGAPGSRALEALADALGELARGAGAHDASLSGRLVEQLDAASLPPQDAPRKPVLFVSPLMGCRLQASLKDRQVKGVLDLPCKRNTKDGEHVQLWAPTAEECSATQFTCFAENLAQVWDNETGALRPLFKGVTVRAEPSFDAAMDLSPDGSTPVYRPYATALERLGFKEGVDMFAFTYDWRAGPETWMASGGPFERLKMKIEATVAATGQPVVAFGFSMGSSVFALFCAEYVSAEWKAVHVAGFISGSGVFSGSALAPYSALMGWTRPGVPRFIVERFKAVTDGMSSLPWLFPQPEAAPGLPVITTPSRQYGPHEMDALMERAGKPQLAELWRRNRRFAGAALAPGVETWCLSAFGVPTIVGAGVDDTLTKPVAEGWVFADGDNTVTVESLRACDRWASVQAAPVHARHYLNVTHGDLLVNPFFFRDVISVLTRGALPRA